ncbi:hypothetical protein LDENG_00168340 [Lucifuga dentata]|nr:hypothetical protein LDENG_00168340 [Lucifuga dentata]
MDLSPSLTLTHCQIVLRYPMQDIPAFFLWTDSLLLNLPVLDYPARRFLGLPWSYLTTFGNHSWRTRRIPPCHCCAALNAVFQKVGLPAWKQKLVSFGSNGAPMMVTELLKGLYKQYHYSPKVWRELKTQSEVLQQKMWKLTNLGTRWLPHVERALQTLMKDYAVVLAHMENTTETRSASADMIGRAKQCVQIKDYSRLLFVVLVQDILKVLSCLSLKLHEDGVTLSKALQG